MERLPTPVFWPDEFHGLHSPWGGKELDTTEHLLQIIIAKCYLLNEYHKQGIRLGVESEPKCVKFGHCLEKNL